MSYLGFLGPTWPLVKPKTSYKVVGRDMETGAEEQFGVVGQV